MGRIRIIGAPYLCPPPTRGLLSWLHPYSHGVGRAKCGPGAVAPYSESPARRRLCRRSFFAGFEGKQIRWIHPAPFRTRKLSTSSPMILHIHVWERRGWPGSTLKQTKALLDNARERFARLEHFLRPSVGMSPLLFFTSIALKVVSSNAWNYYRRANYIFLRMFHAFAWLSFVTIRLCG